METFSDINIGPELGTELIQTLGLDALELQKPDVYARFSDIVAYVKGFADASLVVRRITRNTLPQDRLKKVSEYVALRKELDAIRGELKGMPTSDLVTGDTPEIRARREELATKESLLINEISYYE